MTRLIRGARGVSQGCRGTTEGGVVTQSSASWNQISDFLREVASLRRKVG